ncbi:1-phosphofructokinase family hexose kinase [Mesobacillus subterraneus]|uniref:Tagatose-6-phosphate kinase n=1 Tax=Mesobacillus subterraneus TaxID=285983 RepID=A0A0D6ZEW7_9BACI|nr:1-phosphofructokinase family hexose kinase [Mesobacillus subterraneus]KIY23795.1 hypothetical protein UB32_00860 [Mesobacillus subterraneus]
MILSITLNPSVDIAYRIPEFYLNNANRCNFTQKTAGGKGLNVARVLKSLGMEVMATGFLGGTNGHFIEYEIEKEGIASDFVTIKDSTRNCIAILHGTQQTEILEEGPDINQEEVTRFIGKMASLFQKADVITASGSLPKGIPAEFYAELISLAKRYGKPFLLDTSGKALKAAIDAGPLFIKPNLEEFGTLVGGKLTNEKEAIKALLAFDSNIKFVMVTLGANGALIKTEQTIFKVTIPAVDAVNPVGSGDSVVAGFAAGLAKGMDGETLFSYSTTMGVLNTLETKTGSVNPSLVSNYQHQISVTKIS